MTARAACHARRRARLGRAHLASLDTMNTNAAGLTLNMMFTLW